MMQHLNSEKYNSAQILFDGDEQDFYGLKFNLQSENHKFEIKSSDFYNNRLEKLKNEISERLFQQIIKEGKFGKTYQLGEGYTGASGYGAYFCFKTTASLADKFLFIFSFAETQPTRFKLFLEGIWRE